MWARLGGRRLARLEWCVVLAVTVLVASPSPLRAEAMSAGSDGVSFRLEASLRDPRPGHPATGEVFNEFSQSLASFGSSVVVGAWALRS